MLSVWRGGVQVCLCFCLCVYIHPRTGVNRFMCFDPYPYIQDYTSLCSPGLGVCTKMLETSQELVWSSTRSWTGGGFCGAGALHLNSLRTCFKGAILDTQVFFFFSLFTWEPLVVSHSVCLHFMKESFDMFWMYNATIILWGWQRETNSNSWSNPSPPGMAIAVDVHGSICFRILQTTPCFHICFMVKHPFLADKCTDSGRITFFLSEKFIWLVVWNMFFHILGIIILTDFHMFQRGWTKQPDYYQPSLTI